MLDYLRTFILFTLLSMCLFMAGWYAREEFNPVKEEVVTISIIEEEQKCDKAGGDFFMRDWPTYDFKTHKTTRYYLRCVIEQPDDTLFEYDIQ